MIFVFLFLGSTQHYVSGTKRLTVCHRITAGSREGAGADTDAVRGATSPKHTARVQATCQSTAQQLNGRGKIRRIIYLHQSICS